MKIIFSFLVFLSPFCYSQKIALKNNSDAPINAVTVIEMDSVSNFDLKRIIQKNIIKNVLPKGGQTYIKLPKNKSVIIYASSNLEDIICDFYSIYIFNKKKEIIIDNNSYENVGLECKVAQEQSPGYESSTQLKIQIDNKSEYSISKIFFKVSNQDKFDYYESAISSWKPIYPNEKRWVNITDDLLRNLELKKSDYVDLKIIYYSTNKEFTAELKSIKYFDTITFNPK